MSTKTVLIAHRQAAVRDRFAVALADARHAYLVADSEQAAIEAVTRAGGSVDLALVDVSASASPASFVGRLRASASAALPILVFSGTVASSTDVPALAALGVGFINEHAGTPQILPALAPHLFPDSFNRRTSDRRAIGVPVTYRSGEILTGSVTLDIGKGGIAIRTMNPLPKGTAVQVTFRLPGTPAEIDAAGRVAWSDRKVGMGVQFERMSVSHQRTIEGFIAAH